LIGSSGSSSWRWRIRSIGNWELGELEHRELGAGSWELATGQGDECCAALAPAVAARAPLGNCTI